MESLFLQQALTAYNSPCRTHYRVYGQSMTNLDAVTFYLKQAHGMASPARRTDILITLANMATFSGELSTALRLYEQASHSASASQQQDILCYQAIWHHIAAMPSFGTVEADCLTSAERQQKAQQKAQQAHVQHSHIALTALRALSPQQAEAVMTMIDTLVTVLQTVIPTGSEGEQAQAETDDMHSKHRAWVLLGHKLEADGTLSAILTERLQAALPLVQRWPNSKIIVTGGVQQAGYTEAQRMTEWLVKAGIDRARIIEDNAATNTLDNTHNSLAIAHQHRLNTLTIITHANHLHRAWILFLTMQQQSDNPPLTINATAVEKQRVAAPTGQTALNGVIDALRGMGLPAFRAGSYIQQ